MLFFYNLILGHFVMPATSSSCGGYIAAWERTTAVLHHLVLCGRSEEVFQKKVETAILRREERLKNHNCKS